VSLRELLAKRFHAHRVRARGTVFKLRYKLDRIGQEGARIAAYPPIAGYEGPPLRDRPEAPPTPEHLFGLGKVDARTAIYFDNDLQRVEVLRASSGSLRLQGAWSKNRAGDRGAFLLQTGLTSFGVTLRNGETDWTLAAANDFLRAKGPS
jgi:hypothetical protein